MKYIAVQLFILKYLLCRTETGPIGTLPLSKDPEDWQYVILDGVYKCFLKPIDGSGDAKEMIVLVRCHIYVDSFDIMTNCMILFSPMWFARVLSIIKILKGSQPTICGGSIRTQINLISGLWLDEKMMWSVYLQDRIEWC